MSRGSAGLLVDAVAAAEAEERRTAIRALLVQPLLTAAMDRTAFPLVRKHASALRTWFADQTGWHLHVDAELARLRKPPADTADATRPALARPSRQPFSRRRYVLVCLTLAVLERGEGQITLGWLAERLLGMAGDPALAGAGFAFALDTREDRSDLVAVVRLLIDHGLLARVAGDEQAYVNDSGDALYDVDRRALATVLVTRRGPSTVTATTFDDRLNAVTQEPVPDTDSARTQAARRRLSRRLLDDAVVYNQELDEDELAYLRLPAGRANLLRRLAEATGLVAEVRAEGMALVDPTGEATDLRMPEEGTDGHATLLLAEHLAAARDGAVAYVELVARMRELAMAYSTYWRRSAGEPGGAEVLCRLAVDRLVALRLARMETTADGEVVYALPALARYATGDARVAGSGAAVQATLL